jgi:DNA-binding winged helix-turn-helix (wHTH) protein/TolB-like protein
MPPRETYRFDEFELNLNTYELRRGERPIHMERRPMDLLVLMLQRPGELITRDEIVAHIWGADVFIESESGVNTLIRKVRQAVGDASDAPRFVETVPGRGYRFIAQSVTALALAPAGIVLMSRPSQVSLAVLPFENIGLEPDYEHLPDALHVETIAALGQVDPEHIVLVSRSGTMKYTGSRQTSGEIARELHVAYLVESSLRSENGVVRITSGLVRASDQVQVWSASYDYEPRRMLEFQRDLSAAIAEQISVRLSPARLEGLARRHSADVRAMNLYFKGQHQWNMLTPASTQRAIEYYIQATQRDPKYALPWAGIALAYAAAPINADVPPQAVMQKARDAADRAVQENAGLAETLTARGIFQFWLEWDWPAAEASFERATEADPNYALAQRLIGIARSHMGDHLQAASAMRRLRQLEPEIAMTYALSAQVAFNARDFPATVEHANQARRIDSAFWIARYQEAQALAAQDDYDRALEMIQPVTGVNSKAVSLQGYLFGKSGKPDDARRVLATMEASTARGVYVPPYAFALVHAGLGERDLTLGWLERAEKAHDVHLVALRVDAKWDDYRNDPRFVAVLERCNFMRNGR